MKCIRDARNTNLSDSDEPEADASMLYQRNETCPSTCGEVHHHLNIYCTDQELHSLAIARKQMKVKDALGQRGSVKA